MTGVEGEPEAYRDDGLRGAGISPRERLERIEAMLERIDSKMDARMDSMSARLGLLELNGSKQAQAAEHDLIALTERIRIIEVNVAPRAAQLATDLADHDARLGHIATRLDGVRMRMWMAVGGLMVLMVVLNVGIAEKWF
jgi:hypothetical protein